MQDQGARASFMRAARAGSVVALVLDLLMLSDGKLSLWQQQGLLGSFYDAQARALLDGHLYVPAASASFEGFVVNGHTYLYFGLLPALLRIPVLLITHALDGRMTQLSMLAALVVLMFSAVHVHWRIRELVRPGAALRRGERAGAFLLALALGASVPLFLASWPVVYHEAELWGAALSLAAIAMLLRVVEQPSTGRIALAALLAVLAVQARVSVGLGPIIAMLLLAVGVGARLVHDRIGSAAPVSRVMWPLSALGPVGAPGGEIAGAKILISLIAGAVIALGSAVAVNQARFGSALSIPLAHQVDSRIDPVQRHYIAVNHGAVTSAKFIPTTLWAAIRPDALGTVRAFPFIGLPNSPPHVFGGVTFNALLPTLSAFTSMPLLFLLTIAGLVTVLIRRAPIALLGLMIATAAAFGPALEFGSTATRYLADLLPFLWVGACVGLELLLGDTQIAQESTQRRWIRSGGLVAITALTVVAILVNGAVGIVQQRLLAPGASPGERASFVSFQDSVDKLLGRRPHGISSGIGLPADPAGAVGNLFVLGRCAGLYVQGFGGSWLPVERGPHSGLHDLNVTFPPPRDSDARRHAVLTLGAGHRRVTVLERATMQAAAFSVGVGGRTVGVGAPVPVTVGTPTRVTVSIDQLNGGWYLSVAVPGASNAVLAPVPYQRDARVTLGADPSNPRLARFQGRVRAIAEPTPVCHELVRRAGLTT